ncbi:MAG: tRNA pseudouridine(65) synthase TruC [Myxococcales bacterium]|nr:tRNA pseudouridine(65) synthase TruC [Myxococcales bacterium]
MTGEPWPDLAILWEDDRYLAIDKPNGLFVHRSNLDARERIAALQAVRRLAGGRVHAVHRLDRGTSGVLLFARDREAARALSEQFVARTVQKTYLALVRGHPPEQGELDYPLVPSEGAEPVAAVTAWRTLANGALAVPVGRYDQAWCALVALFPHTGRRHQLRRHLSHLRHPIIGDTSYGDGRNNRAFREALDVQRLMLYARRIAFTHPFNNDHIVIDMNPDATLDHVCAHFGWPAPSDDVLADSAR